MNSITRTKHKVYLIGIPYSQILGAKLPSKKQVLSVLFFNHRTLGMTLRDSAALVFDEVSVFWGKARIPIQTKSHSMDKIVSLHTKWRGLLKSSTRQSEKQKQKEVDFLDSLENLFDIATADALETIAIEEDKKFLLLQREKGRRGLMIGVDTIRLNREMRSLKRSEVEAERIKRANAVPALRTDVRMLTDSSECSIGEPEPMNIDVDEPQPSTSTSNTKIDFINQRIASALDKCKMTDRNAIHLLIAVAEALGHNVNDLIINRTTLRRLRQENRETVALNVKENYKLQSSEPCIVHFDGKILPDLTGKEKVDRQPVIVSNKNGDQLLGVPSLPNGKGEEICSAVFNTLESWELLDNVQAICCDTTASNTGRINGACTLLQRKIGRELLMLPCRHHIFEILLRGAFDTKMGASAAPIVLLFKRFQAKWGKLRLVNKLYSIKYFSINIFTLVTGDLDTAAYKTAIDDENFDFADVSADILNFCKQQLDKQHGRTDYVEFLNLVIIFLGDRETPQSTEISLRAPGAFHHARWMAKAIYCLKIYLLRDQFQLTARELNGIRDICQFIVRLYVKAWFLAPLAALAPNHDLNFLIALRNYETIDKDISRVGLKKMCSHLWYLTKETVGLSFFDENIPCGEKEKMVRAFLGKNPEELDNCSLNRNVIQPQFVHSLETKTIEYFVSKKTATFFKRFNISTDFMDFEPSFWPQCPSYIHGLEVVKNMLVVNDVSERKVKLMEEYNTILTNDEEQKQFLLLTVEHYRKKFPSFTKKSLVSQ